MLDELYMETEERMEKCVEALQRELGALRTGKASPALLDGVMIDAYGSRMPINQLATIGVPEARMLTIQPFDATQLSAIEKGILASDLGITPTNDGNIIRLPIPALNEERRKDYVKLAKKHGEEAKVAIRNVRRDANDQLKKAEKASEITEDDSRSGHDEVQKFTDKFVAKVDKLLETKEKEIMEV
jgi:ribosome recycling factor